MLCAAGGTECTLRQRSDAIRSGSGELTGPPIDDPRTSTILDLSTGLHKLDSPRRGFRVR